MIRGEINARVWVDDTGQLRTTVSTSIAGSAVEVGMAYASLIEGVVHGVERATETMPEEYRDLFLETVQKFDPRACQHDQIVDSMKVREVEP